MRATLLILSALFLVGCAAKTKTASVVIKGSHPALAGKTLYAKDCAPLHYLSNDYLLASCQVAEDGSFLLEVPTKRAAFITLSGDRRLTAHYQILRTYPESYVYSFLTNFFSKNPTLFVEPNRSYDLIAWNEQNEAESIQYQDRPNNLLRSYYRDRNFLQTLIDEDTGKPLPLAPERAWQLITEERDTWLTASKASLSEQDQVFSQFMETEVSLGALNDFLLWYDLQTQADHDPEFYGQMMAMYQDQPWHPLSVEWYRLTERFLAYHLNQVTGQTLTYYPSSKQKAQIANMYLPEPVREAYLANLTKLSPLVMK